MTISCVYVECSTGHCKGTSGDTEGVPGVCAHCEAAFSATRNRRRKASRGLRDCVSCRVPGWWRRRGRIRLLARHAAARSDLVRRQPCHFLAAGFHICSCHRQDQRTGFSIIAHASSSHAPLEDLAEILWHAIIAHRTSITHGRHNVFMPIYFIKGRQSYVHC